MKNIITAAALILTASVASAANLPEKKATPTAPVFEAPSNWYVGVNAGGNVRSDQNVQNTPGVVGAVVGYKMMPKLALEATLDQAFPKNGTQSQTRGTINYVYSPFDSVYGFSPYVLAGVGTQTHDIRDGRNGAKAIYNVGGGVKYAITKEWDADLRYRYINTWNNTNRDTNIVSIGLNYKF
ncbi:COG3637 Opacity protein and related surface antigens [uncultured Caudovirales phage]|uniref:COG3637 Opacity protein and related surface antigens n=1 Tax=uncultured Caudovirales phage TaxID=2100421 RepID=A0A6J7WUG8_9CAUD|nr:COG3637 Opacity protein and related surface antigens [uncultured Caudovirales phage]